MTKKQCIALLLAGGRGTRLKDLTQYIAKPAVPFGGKYRIVDFTLSNCSQSGIDTVGVLTQYQPHTLQNYIGDGRHWDLDRKHGGVTILPPYECAERERWYDGTAHAVYQNMRYIESHHPEYVLIISGDHIYKMDYSLLIEQHIHTKAEATISVIHVPWSEADRFGIMSVDMETNQVTEFEEKPAQPKSNLASMGVYVFSWSALKKYLTKDEERKDFGKDIIPAMLADGRHVYAYQFSGYWKDVGTIESYWEANMDLLEAKTNPFFQKQDWQIYTRETSEPPSYLDEEASIEKSLISEGCKIFGKVQGSVLFHGVTVGKGAVIKDSVILPHAVIDDYAFVERAVIGPDSVIEKNAVVGSSKPYADITLVGEGETVCPIATFKGKVS